MSPQRILLVDDDAAVRDAFGIVLEMAGYEVTRAATAATALAAQGRTRFDLVITDIVMPDMDGLELIRVLTETQPDLPIIALSGGGDFGGLLYLDLARRFGARTALAKPCAPKDVLHAIGEILHTGTTEPPAAPPTRRAAGG